MSSELTVGSSDNHTLSVQRGVLVAAVPRLVTVKSTATVWFGSAWGGVTTLVMRRSGRGKSVTGILVSSTRVLFAVAPFSKSRLSKLVVTTVSYRP